MKDRLLLTVLIFRKLVLPTIRHNVCAPCFQTQKSYWNVEPDQSIDQLARSTVIPLCNLLTNIVQKIQYNYLFCRAFSVWEHNLLSWKAWLLSQRWRFSGKICKFQPKLKGDNQYSIHCKFKFIICSVVP